MPAKPELLTEQLNVAISPRTAARLEAIKAREGTAPAAFARVAIAEKLAGKTSEVSRLAAELDRLGGSSELVLKQAIAAMEDPVVAPPPR